MSDGADPNPRKTFDEAVRYAVHLSNVYLSLLETRDISADGLRYLELGPGADFAPHLVLASHGVRVTLADMYLSSWDPNYHPEFYRAFLAQWPGRKEAVEAALARNGYDGLLTLAAEPAERMPSLKDHEFDFVQSNAVLEHVVDLRLTVKELARVTRVGGVHSHQVDFRDHRNFDKPLEYLLLDPAEFRKVRSECKASCGTTQRMPEMIEEFSRYFWVWETEVNMKADMSYVREIITKLPHGSPYRSWPPQLLKAVSGRLCFVRKSQRNGVIGFRRPEF